MTATAVTECSAELDDAHARRRESRLGAAGQLRCDPAAVRLVTDDDDASAAAVERCAEGGRTRTRGEAVVGLRRRPRRLRDLGPGLTRAQERAREDDVGSDAVGCELLPERPRLLAADGGQRAQ